MSITVNCLCGKKLKAPDRLAGKRAKCPRCGKALEVPRLPETDTSSSASSPSSGGKTCVACGQPMSHTAVVCEACGFSAVASRDADAIKTPKGHYANQDTSRSLFNIMGVDFTWPKTVLAGAILAAISGSVIWYLTGPGRDVHVLAVQTVQLATAFSRLDTRGRHNLVTGGGDPSLGGKSTGSAAAEIVYVMGGKDQLILTRPDPDGRFMIVDLEMSQRLIEGNKSNADLYFIMRQDMFKLGDDGGEALKPILLFSDLDQTVTIELAESECSNYKSLLPPDMEPTYQDLVKQSGGVSEGTVYFDGSTGVEGQLEFSAPYFKSGRQLGVSGLYAEGQLQMKTAEGISVGYEYRGSDLALTWNSEVIGRWAKPRYKQKKSLSSYKKHRVSLLFERPQASGKLRLSFADQEIGRFKNASTFKSAPAQTSAELAARMSSETSKPKFRSGEIQSRGYFGALARARQMGRGVGAMSNMRQLGYAISLYVDAHGGALPDRLEQLRSTIDALDQLVINQRTGDNPGFIYEKPESTADLATTAILFESKSGRKDPNGSVLYLDGHIRPGL